MIKNCNKKLQGQAECFVGSMQMVHLKKDFTNPCTSNGAAVTRLKKWQLYIIYLNVQGIEHRHTKDTERIQKSTHYKCCYHRKSLFFFLSK